MMTIPELKARVAAVEGRVARAQTAASGLDLVVVRRAVAEELGAIVYVAPEHITESDRLAERYHLSALQRLDLLLRLELRLDVALDVNGAAWATVGDVVREVVRAPRLG